MSNDSDPNEDLDALDLYMKEIKQYPLLTPEEEKQLAIERDLGNDQACKKLVDSNLRLVVKIAYDYTGLGLSLLDLIQHGSVGLMRAAEKFDPTKKTKFSYYSSWWIKQGIKRGLSNQSRTIRLPVGQSAKVTQICQANKELEKKLGRDPTKNEISEQTDLPAGDISSILQTSRLTVSIHELKLASDGETGQGLLDTIADSSIPDPYQELSGLDTHSFLLKQVEKLDPIKRNIIELRFGLLTGMERPLTLHEVGKIVNMSGESVRRIEEQALRKLQVSLSELI